MREALFWLTGWKYGASWWGRHGNRSKRQLLTLLPQTGSGEQTWSAATLRNPQVQTRSPVTYSLPLGSFSSRLHNLTKQSHQKGTRVQTCEPVGFTLRPQQHCWLSSPLNVHMAFLLQRGNYSLQSSESHHFLKIDQFYVNLTSFWSKWKASVFYLF